MGEWRASTAALGLPFLTHEGQCLPVFGGTSVSWVVFTAVWQNVCPPCSWLQVRVPLSDSLQRDRGKVRTRTQEGSAGRALHTGLVDSFLVSVPHVLPPLLFPLPSSPSVCVPVLFPARALPLVSGFVCILGVRLRPPCDDGELSLPASPESQEGLCCARLGGHDLFCS